MHNITHTHTSRLEMMHLKHTTHSRFAIIKMPSQKLSPIQPQPAIQGHTAFQDSNDNSGILIPWFQLSSHPPAFRQFQNWCQVLWNVQEPKNILWCSNTEKNIQNTQGPCCIMNWVMTHVLQLHSYTSLKHWARGKPSPKMWKSMEQWAVDILQSSGYNQEHLTSRKTECTNDLRNPAFRRINTRQNNG